MVFTKSIRWCKFWLRQIWLRSTIWLRFGYGKRTFGYDMVTVPWIWLRFGYGVFEIWLRHILVTVWLQCLEFGYDVVTVFLKFGYGIFWSRFGNVLITESMNLVTESMNLVTESMNLVTVWLRPGTSRENFGYANLVTVWQRATPKSRERLANNLLLATFCWCAHLSRITILYGYVL